MFFAHRIQHHQISQKQGQPLSAPLTEDSKASKSTEQCSVEKQRNTEQYKATNSRPRLDQNLRVRLVLPSFLWRFSLHLKVFFQLLLFCSATPGDGDLCLSAHIAPLPVQKKKVPASELYMDWTFFARVEALCVQVLHKSP